MQGRLCIPMEEVDYAIRHQCDRDILRSYKSNKSRFVTQRDNGLEGSSYKGEILDLGKTLSYLYGYIDSPLSEYERQEIIIENKRRYKQRELRREEKKKKHVERLKEEQTAQQRFDHAMRVFRLDGGQLIMIKICGGWCRVPMKVMLREDE